MAARKRGGQPTYRQDIADEILERLAEGEPIEQICRDPHMPPASTVKTWVLTKPDFVPLAFIDGYARARVLGLETLAYQVLSISDESCFYGGEPNNALVQQHRLQAESRKWLLSKMLPAQFGDKVTAEIVGDSDRPLVSRIELVPVAPITRQVEGKIIDHDEGSE